jgi:hypothetical protein
MKGNTKMIKVYVELKTRKNIFPFNSEMGALYFATSLREYAEIRREYLPAITVISDETGEVLYEQPEICPCEWYDSKEFGKAQARGANLCQSCLKTDCGLRDSALPW